MVLTGQRILELPIPTYYGEEVCRVNGMKHAWEVCKTMLRVFAYQIFVRARALPTVNHLLDETIYSSTERPAAAVER